MSRLDHLRLVTRPVRTANTPIRRRRDNVVRALDEQIRLAEMMAGGERYTATVQRWEIDPATGERRRIEWPRRVYAWFWQVDGAEWFVTLRRPHALATATVRLGIYILEREHCAEALVTPVFETALAGEYLRVAERAEHDVP